MPFLSDDDLLQQTLANLRAALTNLTFDSLYFSAAEQLQANHRAHECEDTVQLTQWLVATANELARRLRAAKQLPRYATATQRELLRALLPLPTVSRARKTRVLLDLNRLTPAEAASELRQLWGLVAVDGVADGRDRRRAATFQVKNALTYAALSQHNGRPNHA